jgi:hypothetical protein
MDEIGPGGAPYPINDIVETRGYTGKDPRGFKRFTQTNIAVRTFNPSFTVSSISDGYNEVKRLTSKPVTKDRLRRYIHGKKFFNPATDDPDALKREDYSVAGQTSTVDDPKLQQTLEPYQIRQNGRFSSIQVANSGGKCDVMAVTVDMIPAQEGIKVLA